MKRKVIKAVNLPPKISVSWVIIAILWMKVYDISPFGQGVIYAIMAIGIIAEIISIFMVEGVDLFEDNSKKEP